MNISPALGSYLDVEESFANIPNLEIIKTDSIEGRECLLYLPFSYDGSIPESFLARAGQKIGGGTSIIWISNLLVHMGRFYGSGVKGGSELYQPARPSGPYYNFKRKYLIKNTIVKNRSFMMTPFSIGFNFYHFLIDTLPRFQCRELFARSSSPFIISTIPTAFQNDVMSLILKKRYPIYDTTKAILLRECAVSSHVSRPAAVDFLRDRSRHITRNKDCRRIYISRRNSLFRRIVNESELEPVLAKFGFTIVDCETLSFDQQVSLFKAAEIVCGPHGAGLANIAFCQKDTSVLEIIMEERAVLPVGNAFWDLACAGDLKYHILSGTRIPVDEKHEYDGAMYVDPAKLELALDYVILLHGGK